MITIDEKGYDQYGRPCKQLYFMDMAFTASKRSLDKRTKHGCVIVSHRGGVISTGYNSPPAGCDETIIPSDAPDKYLFYEHAERNAIFYASSHAFIDSIFYVTGLPCMDCLRAILGVGASELIYGPLNANMCQDLTYFDRYDIMLKGLKLKVRRFEYDESLFKENKFAETSVSLKPLFTLNKKWNC
jgi:dCMP deaminase